MKKSIPLLLFFLTGLVAGFFVKNVIIFNRNTPLYSIIRSPNKKLTNPLIDCEQYESSALIKINTLKREVEEIIKKYPSVNIALYYRNLNNGPWFGINESSQFSPHSLLKVPILIAYLKKAESDPEVLNKKINYSGKQSISKNIFSQDQLTPNNEYTVDELLNRMVSLSDNTALELLYKNIDENYIKAIHQELDIPYPNNTTPNDYLTVRTYASLFRILYNATYLSRDMSEKALHYLLQSDFTQGIRTSLPKNTTTALKYGVMPASKDSPATQLHECGIIYAKNNPYILCIMTKGNDLKTAVKFINEASKLIYQEVTKSK